MCGIIWYMKLLKPCQLFNMGNRCCPRYLYLNVIREHKQIFGRHIIHDRSMNQTRLWAHYVYHPAFSICLSVGLPIKKFLAVCMNAIYRYIMFSAILWKRAFGHNFWTETHRMVILVSRSMFWGSRSQMVPFVLIWKQKKKKHHMVQSTM